MRALNRAVVAAAAAVIVAGSAAAQQPQWFQLYDDAIVDVRQGAWQQAETKLRQAQKLGPAPGRNVLRYGMMRGNFFPDFYLGVVFLNTGRPTDALRQFALARAQKINEEDREFRTIADMENQARVDAKRLADATAMPTTIPAATATSPVDREPEVARPVPAPVTPPAPAPNALAGRLEDRIEAALTKRDFASARSSVVDLRALDAPAADRLAGRIATLERLLLSGSERDAMQLFFGGEYRKTVAVLDQIERELGARLSPRGYFYRACALAAQALGSSRVDTRLLDNARRQFAEALRDGKGLTEDRRYVSPKILQALGS